MGSNGHIARSATAAGMLAALLLATPALAQSMFDQMPDAPEQAAPAAAEEAKPAQQNRMSMPDVSAASPAPSNIAPMFDKPAEGAPPMVNQAQCQSIQKILEQRKALVAKANVASNAKKKMTPAQACALFGQLTANGNAGIKWIKTNKEACGVPESFEQGFTADNGKVAAIRTKVCNAAAQYTKMEAQAREQAQNGGGGGLLGGPGLQGSFKLPQGAL